jgi:hypothetical protein
MDTHQTTAFLDETQYDSWNRFVEESPQGDVFCYTWWLDAVTRGDFKILAVWENNRIAAGIILPFYGSGRINEPYLTRTTGVLYKKPGRESPRKRLSQERRWLNTLLDQVNINSFVQMCLHHHITDWLPFLWHGYRQTTRYTYLLDYQTTSVEEIWRHISYRQKAIVRKALNNNLRVEEDENMANAHAFSCRSYGRQNSKFPYALEDLLRLDDAVQKHGSRKIFKATDPYGCVHAVNYVVYNRNSAYHLLSGSDPRCRGLGGHTLLLWHTIKYFSDKAAIFNFGGSDIQPIEKHFRSFGGIQTQYFRVYNDALVANREGLRYHAGQMTHHGREILKALRRRQITEYPALFYKLFER